MYLNNHKMATIFDILQHLESNKNQYCKRYQSNCSSNKSKSIDFIPALDVIEDTESLIVQVELPGVDKQDINIEIKESVLTIQGEKKTLSKNNSTVSSSATSNTGSSTTTTSTTNTPTTSTESTDLPSIEEFEEGDSTINKSASNTSTSTESIKNEDNKSIKKKYISERSSGHFKRYVDLTKILYTLDLSSISTNYSNGLLTVSIKKNPEYANTIKININ